ncbi:uncharacterized protein SOCEGT47_032010 [Sorangium cellulosum]|uniref:Uncharacterized protein n=1 Tax=Sorangium cellulosum TaxID=56 RepID=A0A4P2Q0H9_SORCE|nr:hypothetical protein [Sorangium cellulosum]AUX22695.1 uncharacterized protein SOCEGT47_032010 [Sorangium cellulosum]
MSEEIAVGLAIAIPALAMLYMLGDFAWRFVKPSLAVRRLEARAAAGDPEARARLARADGLREAARRAMGGEDPDRKRILASGRAARATIAEVRPTGLKVSASAVPMRIVEVDLDLDEGSGQRVTVCDAVSEIHLGRLLKGASVPVRVDPLSADRVVVLWDTL